MTGRGRLAVAMTSLLFLGACAETQLIAHTAKQISRAAEDDSEDARGLPGEYKVGKPYAINGVWYYPKVDYAYTETGIASWYGPKFHRKYTANGEVFDMNGLTAAHRTLPLPSVVRVTNLGNGRSIRLRVNDRGPFARGRIIDISRRGAQLLGFDLQGTARVRVELLEAESRVLAMQYANAVGAPPPDTPITNEEAARKPDVASESLAPPPGGEDASKTYVPSPTVDIASRDPLPIVPEPLDGRVTVEPVSPTRLFVQVGAFNYYENARRVAVMLKGPGAVNISSVIVEGKEYFRVRVGPAASIDEADRFLDNAIEDGFPDSRVVVDDDGPDAIINSR